MKNLFNRIFLFSVLGFFAMSCSDDEEIVTDPTDEFDVELTFAEGNGDVTESVSVTPTDGTISARVQISSSSNMRRVYITRSVGGTGFEPYTPADLSSAATKPDGSLDVETNPNDIDYTLDLDVPTGISQGTVIYRFWATSGRGDYRDPDKRFVAGIGEIQLLYGGTNPAAPVSAYTATILAAPLGDGSSETFISLYNGELYPIADGEEFASFWDFGYYYGETGLASLASTYRYPFLFDDDNDDTTPLVSISELTGVPREELNRVAFDFSGGSSADFDNISVSGDLDFVSLSVNSDNTNGRINDLEEGDIIDFIDEYGKKGLIRVVDIQGTDGADGQITIDIKVQP